MTWNAAAAELVTQVIVLGSIGALYAIGLARTKSPSRSGMGNGEAACFGGGLVVVLAALSPPVDRIADAVFWWHMVQHLLLIVVAAPLLILGQPWLAFERVGPSWFRWAQRAVLTGTMRTPAMARRTAALALAASTGALLFWHAPAPFQAALRSAGLHGLEHATLLATATVFWWSVLAPIPRARLGAGIPILALTAAGLLMSGLGALMTFTPEPWYPAYAAQELARGLAPLSDQQAAGLIMWIPGGLVYLGMTAWLFVRWIGQEDGIDPSPSPSIARRTGDRPRLPQP